MDLTKLIEMVLSQNREKSLTFKEFVKGYHFYNSMGFSKKAILKVHLKSDLHTLRNARIVCGKKYDPPSDSREHWIGMALAQLMEVLSKYVSENNLSFLTKLRLTSNLKITAIMLSKAIQRYSWGEKVINQIKIQLLSITKTNKIVQEKRLYLLAFERNFAK